MLSLTICVLARAAAALADPAPPPLIDLADLRTAPLIAPWPEGLPGPRTDDGGTYLPAPLAEEVARRLRLLELLPRITQAQLDGLAASLEVDCTGRLAVARATAAAAQVRGSIGDPGWPTWLVVAVGVGAVAVGALAGYAFR